MARMVKTGLKPPLLGCSEPWLGEQSKDSSLKPSTGITLDGLRNKYRELYGIN